MDPWTIKLRTRVEKAGTQEHVAHEVGVSLSTLQRYLSGESFPRKGGKLEALERVLGPLGEPPKPTRAAIRSTEERIARLERIVALLSAQIAAQPADGDGGLGDRVADPDELLDLLERRATGRAPRPVRARRQRRGSPE